MSRNRNLSQLTSWNQNLELGIGKFVINSSGSGWYGYVRHVSHTVTGNSPISRISVASRVHSVRNVGIKFTFLVPTCIEL